MTVVDPVASLPTDGAPKQVPECRQGHPFFLFFDYQIPSPTQS